MSAVRASSMPEQARLLEVRDLAVSFRTADGIVQAVRGVSFAVDAGQTLGIVGESGSGKSVSTQTIMGLTRGARISGQAMFEGRDLLTLPLPELRKIRGAEIGMIFQDPLSSLHPYYKVGWQIVEMIRQHDHDMSKQQARARAVAPGFGWADPDDAAAVIDICQRLDGMALAIELAAARMVSMSPQDVRDRLDDRFRLLSGPRRELERHQTLRLLA